MNRPIVACAFFALATAALCAQQPNQSDPYSGTSNPPPDDTIESSAPLVPKPPAGKPLNAPVLPPAAAPQVVPAQPADTANPDGGMVQPAPASPDMDARQPRLNTRASSGDPDGDIVHPAPLPPGTIGEGTTIRVHLKEGLSTSDTVRGQAFRSTVASDVLEHGQVLIPAGAEVDGHVVEVSSGHTGGHGFMRLRPESVVMPDGKRYRLSAYVAGAPGSRTQLGREGDIGADTRYKKDAIEYGGAMGVGAITGAALGGPAGALAGTIIGAGAVTVHLLVDHPQATLDPGSTLLFTLTEPLSLVQEDTASNEPLQ